MGSKFKTHLRQLPAKARVVVGLFAVWLLQAALDRLSKFLIPEGSEAQWFGRAVEWLRGMLNIIPTDWLIVALVTALTLYVWDERYRLVGKVRGAAPEQETPNLTPRALARALDDLYAEGTRARNRLIPAIPNFDHDAERARLVAWKQRVLDILDSEHISVAEYSRFRTLGEVLVPAGRRTPGKGDPQYHVEAMWNESRSRLRQIIDRLGA